jgi:cell division ATPase FtsA
LKATNTNFTALDIGSSKVSVLAANVDFSGDARIGYQWIFKSSGIKAGIFRNKQISFL